MSNFDRILIIILALSGFGLSEVLRPAVPILRRAAEDLHSISETGKGLKQDLDQIKARFPHIFGQSVPE